MLEKVQSETKGGIGGSISQLGKNKMNRSESGSSLLSGSIMGQAANKIDNVKIERLLTVFNLL